MNLTEIGWEIVDWMPLAQDRNQWRVLVKTGSINGGEFLDLTE
jgi:hypothetical protein